MGQHSVLVNLILKAEDQAAATTHVYARLAAWMIESPDAPYPGGSLLFFAEHKCNRCEIVDCDQKTVEGSLFCEYHDAYEFNHLVK